MRTMLLIGQSGNSIHPFPCHIDIERRCNPDTKNTYFVVICDGEYVIAKYQEMVPAKMEVTRLRGVWHDDPNATEFQFLKDVKE